MKAIYTIPMIALLATNVAFGQENQIGAVDDTIDAVSQFASRRVEDYQTKGGAIALTEVGVGALFVWKANTWTRNAQAQEAEKLVAKYKDQIKKGDPKIAEIQARIQEIEKAATVETVSDQRKAIEVYLKDHPHLSTELRQQMLDALKIGHEAELASIAAGDAMKIELNGVVPKIMSSKTKADLLALENTRLQEALGNAKSYVRDAQRQLVHEQTELNQLRKEWFQDRSFIRKFGRLTANLSGAIMVVTGTGTLYGVIDQSDLQDKTIDQVKMRSATAAEFVQHVFDSLPKNQEQFPPR